MRRRSKRGFITAASVSFRPILLYFPPQRLAGRVLLLIQSGDRLEQYFDALAVRDDAFEAHLAGVREQVGPPACEFHLTLG
jgi:hypothetical protein